MQKSDVTFIREMIAHHQAAIEMANAYLDDTDPSTRQARVASWAREIATGQADEIARVSKWLPSGTSTSGMSGMKM